MLKGKLIIAVAAGLVVSACGSDPYSYSEPRYVSSGSYSRDAGPYARDAAYNDFGRVVAIDVVRGGGHSSGAGAVVGGIVGGVLGHQVGSGRGNEVEKRRDSDEQYRVVVQFRDGREATFVQDSLNGIRVGDRVRVDGGRLYRD